MNNEATSRYAAKLIMGYSKLGVDLYNCMYWWGSSVQSLQCVSCMEDDCNDCIGRRWLEDVPVVE